MRPWEVRLSTYFAEDLRKIKANWRQGVNSNPVWAVSRNELLIN